MDETRNTGLTAGLSDGDALVVQKKLLRLLEKQTNRYTGGDSSSVRAETARELLASVLFTLDFYLCGSGNGPALLVSTDPEELLARGQQAIEDALAQFDRLYAAACLGAPEIENIAFRDTLRSLGAFRRRYDRRLFAHAIPCDIDYPLCRPVPETLAGVAYVNEYLRRIVVENDFLRRFPKAAVIGLLESYCPDYRGLLINLFEPVAVNALGRSLLGLDPRPLEITDAARAEIAEKLDPLTAGARRAALSAAAGRLGRTLGSPDAGAREYLARTADDLCPRLETARDAGGLSGIFLPFRAEPR